MRIDLNSDLGESFGPWPMGHDAALMDSISSANVACGFHAGDPGAMRATVALAREKGVAIGAHPGFQDLVGFGRREMRVTPSEVEDLVLTTLKTVRDSNVASVEDVRKAGRRLVGYSPDMARRVKELKDFLFTNMYRNYRVVRMGDKAGRILRDLFLSYVGEPLQLPPHYQERIPRDGMHRVVCDYIAGMTDRFAVDEHRKLFDPMVRV